jgi:hypothetical protein
VLHQFGIEQRQRMQGYAVGGHVDEK